MPQRKENGKTKHSGNVTANPKHQQGMLMTPQMRRTIACEASALGLTPREYLRLAIILSSHIRENFAPDDKLDAKQLLTLVDNPLFGILLKTVTQTLLNKATAAPEANGAKEPAVSSPTPQQQPPVQQPVIQRQSEQQMWEFW